jgi:UDP-N-acetylglucosamine 4,6-dehydratase
VRYGNVIGSRGSVVPFFKKLVTQGIKKLPVTDSRMTRFWITLDQGINFVINSFSRMQGGEIFVPKIPSMRVIDLVKSLGNNIDHEIIGIRPGEKLHEVMCPKDDAHRTIEFHDHHVIMPAINFHNKIDFFVNCLNEKGKSVEDCFEYSSNKNPHFLTIDELKELNRTVA